MSELEKALERLRARPPRADFADVRRVLEANGWEQRRQKGSHVTFVRTGHPSFTVPIVDGRRVKRTYVERLFDLLELGD